MVLTGSEKAFAAGADIKEMQPTGMANNFMIDFLGDWTGIKDIKKPIIAAVNGFALGGGEKRGRKRRLRFKVLPTSPQDFCKLKKFAHL